MLKNSVGRLGLGASPAKLNKKGRKILKRDGKLNATLKIRRKLAGGKTKKLKAKKLVFKKK